ncbi:biotin transporter BioY [Aestuariibius sp. HNIBRBA575]|uniref:biotin transporter BioY n=1 Tax=Aestuariibius sp. HNIBRBA575 TaxID=3233343 RepID=UPI0034A277E1
MHHPAAMNHPPSFSPLSLSDQATHWKMIAVLVGTIVLAVSSRIEVPMYPVPVTMQTFAVTMIGALYGWRLGGITVLTWLGEAAMGAPVLAGGAGGLAHFAGPTGGYLASFPIIAALTGFLAEKGWNGGRVWLAFLAMSLANVLCLLIGASWLATFTGVEKAIVLGVTPFLIGAVLKSALGAVILRQWTRYKAV